MRPVRTERVSQPAYRSRRGLVALASRATAAGRSGHASPCTACLPSCLPLREVLHVRLQVRAYLGASAYPLATDMRPCGGPGKAGKAVSGRWQGSGD